MRLALAFKYNLTYRTTTVYAGGEFTSIGGQLRNYLATIDATVGAATFSQA